VPCERDEASGCVVGYRRVWGYDAQGHKVQGQSDHEKVRKVMGIFHKKQPCQLQQQDWSKRLDDFLYLREL